MNTIRTSLAVLSGAVMAGTLLLAGCATTHYQTDVQRLEAYQAYAGAPVRKIPYFSPIGWEEIDDQRILVSMKPSEVWLMRLSGPCMEYAGGSPALVISSQAGYVSSGFDRVATGSSQLSCRIEEIRQVDTIAMREARAAQPSGT